MATLTPTEQDELRRHVAGDGYAGAKTKPDFTAAFQSIENWFEANRAALATAIVGTWTVSQKKALVKHWLLQKFGRE